MFSQSLIILTKKRDDSADASWSNADPPKNNINIIIKSAEREIQQ